MSARLDFKGVRISAYAPKDSFRFYQRRKRLARVRGAVLRAAGSLWLTLALALFLAVTLGISTNWQAVQVIAHFVGVN